MLKTNNSSYVENLHLMVWRLWSAHYSFPPIDVYYVCFTLEDFHARAKQVRERPEKEIREIGTNHLPAAVPLFGNM